MSGRKPDCVSDHCNILLLMSPLVPLIYDELKMSVSAAVVLNLTKVHTFPLIYHLTAASSVLWISCRHILHKNLSVVDFLTCFSIKSGSSS